MTPPFTISFTLRVNESVEEHKGCAVHDEEFGRGQNTGMGWNDPTFAHDFVAKMTPGSFQPITRNEDLYCPRACTDVMNPDTEKK
jgi:hypothetical protein